MWGEVVKVISLIGNNEFLRNRVSHSARILTRMGVVCLYGRALFSLNTVF